MQQELPLGRELPPQATPLTEEQKKENDEVIQAYIALALQIYTRLKDEGKEIKK